MQVCDLCGSGEFMKYCDLGGKIKRSVFICKNNDINLFFEQK